MLIKQCVFSCERSWRRVSTRCAIVLFVALIAPSSPKAQTRASDSTFIIRGKVATLDAPAKAYLFYSAYGKRITDSTDLKKGEFTFKGFAPAEPAQAFLALKRAGESTEEMRDYCQVFIERGAITITSPNDSISKARLAGTPLNTDLNDYNEMSTPLDSLIRTHNDKIATLDQQSESFKTEQVAFEKKINQMQVEIAKHFIQTHPASPISSRILNDLVQILDYGEAKPLYETLTPTVRESPSGKNLAEQLTKMKIVAIGAAAPDFELPDTAGNKIKLSSLRGKYVLIDLWASWCGPCRQENPNVVRSYNKYKDKNFTIIGVSLDKPDGRDKWTAAIRHDGLSWTQVSDLKFWNSEVAQAYGVNSIPQNFLLDPSGKIIAKNLRGDDLDKQLEKTLR